MGIDRRFERVDFVEDFVYRTMRDLDFLNEQGYTPSVIGISSRAYCIDYARTRMTGEIGKRGWNSRIEEDNGKTSIEAGTVTFDIDSGAATFV